MATARRDGPDFLFLANAHSKKISDLESNKEVQITFQDSKTQDWISVSGTATTSTQTRASRRSGAVVRRRGLAIWVMASTMLARMIRA
jgi:pyridoxine/pyridoxamine 5'-phosphate oxidase